MHGGYMQLLPKNYINNFLTFIILFICFTLALYAQMPTILMNGTSSNSTPDAPIAIGGNNDEPTSFSANWDSVSGAMGYLLDVALDNGFTTFVTGFNDKDVANVTSYSVTGLSANTIYHYRVRAYNTYGISVNSNTIDAKTMMTTPTATAATNVLQTSFSANWNSVEGATRYYLDVATDAGFTTHVAGYIEKEVANVLTYSVTGLNVGTTYYYRVCANNTDGGASKYSNSINVTTFNGSPTITSFTPTSGPIGTTVTITGTNLNPVATNNVVYFGAVKAQVLSSASTQLTVTVPIGATYQPITITDITTGLTAYSTKPFTVTFPSSQIVDATSFASQVDFTTGMHPQSATIGDVDGDGKPDLIVANQDDGTVSVFRNKSNSGSITVSSFDSRVDFSTGSAPSGVAIGDLDGDGKPDLVITNQNSNTVSILRNTSTSSSITASSFASKVDFTTGTNPQGVAISDIDGDGKPDVIVTNLNSGTVSVFRNTSTSGSITASSFVTKVDFTTGSNPWRVAISDVDCDGKPDLVIADFYSNTVSILRNTSTSGSITASSFAPKVGFTTDVSPYNSIAIGDVDSDGKPDLVVTNYSNSSVSVFRNTSTVGSITASSFASRIDFTTGVNPWSAAISDVNGDGKPDLIVTSPYSGTVSVFKNTSTAGSITTSSFASKVDFAARSGANSIAIGDVDGDGKPDVVVGNYSAGSVSVLRNMMGGSLPHPTIISFTPIRNALNVVQSTGVTVTFDTSMNAATFTDSAIRINGSLSGLHPSVFSYNELAHTVTVTPNTQFKIGELVTVTLTSRIKSLTGDSLTNGYSWSFTVMTNACSGLVYQSSTVGVGNTPWYLAAADFNGDSAIDLAVVNNYSNDVSILTNNGKGIFTKTSTIKVGNYPGSIATADLDGDGDMDLAVTNSGSNTVSILKNNGHGTFTQTSTVSVPGNPWNVAAADLDGDGAIDLAIAGYSGTVSILKNDGSGSFTLTSTITVGSHAYSVTAADLNGDGAIDLAVTDYGLNTVAILTNSGSGGFILTSTINVGEGSMAAAAADLDGDGAIDLAVANFYSNTISILKNNGSGTFTLTSTINTENYPTSIIAMDAEGKGIMDLAVVNAGSGSVSILKNNGSGSFTLASTASTDIGSSPRIVTTADLDGDGRIDLAAVILNLNSVSIIKNRASHDTIPLQEIVQVAGGTFQMGSNDPNDYLASPPHSVSLGSYYIDKYEVTYEKWTEVRNWALTHGYASADIAVGVNGYSPVGTNNPVGDVNWYDILKWCNARSEKDSLTPVYYTRGAKDTVYRTGELDLAADAVKWTANGYRLPTEAEWEFAARGGNQTHGYMYSGSNTLGDVAWYYTNSGNTTHQVGIKSANELGIYDMSGNASERCWDWCNTYDASPQIDPKGPTSGYAYRVVRGGSFASAGPNDDNCRVAYRTNAVPAGGRYDNYGFRCASTILQNHVSGATIGISSSRLSFGSVSVGSSKSEYLKIYNYGTDSSLVVSNITSSNATFIVNRTSLTIAPSGCDSILVTFLPTTKGTIFNDSLILSNNDTVKPNIKVSLTGSSTFSQPKVAFTINLGGPVYAGISVLGDNALYAIASGYAVYRMNAAGSIAYMLQVAGDIRSSSSIAYDTTVYIASSDRNLYAFSKDGNSIWVLPTGGVLTATPVVDSIANRLYIGVSNHNFIAVNRSTGKVDWNYFADGEIRNSAVVTNDRKLVFATQKGTLYGFDLNNLTSPATPTWQIALPDTTPSSIALDNQGYIYVGTSVGRLLKISMQINQQPSIVWQVHLGQAIVGSPVIDASGILYAGSLDANLYAVDIQSGSVKWSFSTKGAIRSTPAISDAGNIFVANDSGEVILLDTSKNMLWYYKASSAIAAPLLYYKSTLYVGTLGNQVIALYDAADSSLLHKTESSQQKTGKPVWATFQGNNQRTGLFSSSGTTGGTTGIKNSSSDLPIDYTLMQNYPNPFNPSTTIQFALPKEGRVSIKIFNMLGKHIATLIDEFQYAGYHEVTFNLDSFSSGIYFYQMRAGSFIETKKMMLMK